MNTFTITVMVNNHAADYEFFAIGSKFKASLVHPVSPDQLPFQLTFWKENGQWKSYQSVTAHTIYQFGSCIDNHLTALEVKNLKGVVAA